MQDQESSSCIFWHHWFGPSVAAAGSHVVRSSTYRTRWEVNITSFRFFLVSWGTQNRFRLWHFGTFSLPKEKSQRWKSSTLKVIRKMRWSMFFFFLTVNQSFSIGHHTSFCIIFQLIWFVNTFKDRRCHRNAYIVRAWILHLDQQQEIWGVYATCFFIFFNYHHSREKIQSPRCMAKAPRCMAKAPRCMAKAPTLKGSGPPGKLFFV